jgi:sugar phosphate isomerase/epimerase
MERRTFLRTAALSALAAASMSPLSLGQPGQRLQQAREGREQRRQERRQPNAATKKIPIAVQVYSVRNAVQADPAAGLEKIAKMGYEGIEIAGGGFYGKTGKELRKMLDDTGLKCCGSHTGLDLFRGDNFAKTAEFHKEIGAKFMIVPGLPQADFLDLEKNKQLAEEFNQLAEKAKPLGLVIGYHAHGFDAKLIDGIPAWERFFDATVPEVVHQMDIGNYMGGGGDPYKMIEKFKGRSKTVHLKEHPGKEIIGEGEVDWNRAFELCETIGGVEWYVVEDEVTPDSFDRIEKCIVALRGMGK